MFDKQSVLDLIQQHGDAGKLDQARQQLPDQVDPQEHGDLL